MVYWWVVTKPGTLGECRAPSHAMVCESRVPNMAQVSNITQRSYEVESKWNVVVDGCRREFDDSEVENG